MCYLYRTPSLFVLPVVSHACYNALISVLVDYAILLNFGCNHKRIVRPIQRINLHKFYVLRQHLI
ncbi:hypothetical protein SKL01_04670 [Staphylococcus kloosii]|uniref:CAAX protease n=1 Tax=Staphylococcus kloosii TaxID=29384 RepID=A0ABQ0XNP3_9STAP|nr:hypothetical protein SKL01_04670 [Staphylococcus kloosii]